MLRELEITSVVNMTETFWETFGAWLKAEREKADVSQGKVSKKADIHVVQISRIENGRSGAKRETIIQIVNAINDLSEKYKINIDDALKRAGFFSESNSDSHQILEGVTVQFDHSVKLSGEEKEKILEAMRLVAAGVKARQEK